MGASFDVSRLVGPMALTMEPKPDFDSLALRVRNTNTRITSSTKQMFTDTEHAVGRDSTVFRFARAARDLIDRGNKGIITNSAGLRIVDNTSLQMMGLTANDIRATALSATLSRNCSRKSFTMFIGNSISLAIACSTKGAFNGLFPMSNSSDLG